MYKQENKTAAIKEIQRYLYFISDDKNSAVPRVFITGTFDEDTTDAVKAFQRESSLYETGIVDNITFDFLYRRYMDLILERNTSDYILGDGAFPLKEGDQNEDVRAFHLMLNELSKYYPQIRNVGSGSYFSRRTSNSVSALRDLFLLPGAPILDKVLYRRIKNEIDARKLASKINA